MAPISLSSSMNIPPPSSAVCQPRCQPCCQPSYSNRDFGNDPADKKMSVSSINRDSLSTVASWSSSTQSHRFPHYMSLGKNMPLASRCTFAKEEWISDNSNMSDQMNLVFSLPIHRSRRKGLDVTHKEQCANSSKLDHVCLRRSNQVKSNQW